MTPESVVYSFGTLLLDLLSGKHIPPSHVSFISSHYYVWGVVLSIGIPSYVNVIGYDTVTASGLNGLLGTLQLTLRI